MFMYHNNKIDFANIEVNKQYLYEESYYIQANVTILEDNSDDEMFRYKLRVDEWINGEANKLEPGYTFNIAKRKDGMGDYLLKMSFKPVGSLPEYMFW
jgi:hypothetical protein